MRPRLPRAEALLPYLAEIDQSQRYTNFGPLVKKLEQGLAELLDAKGAVSVSSASIALELSIAALELPKRSLIALPSLNFPAAAHAIINNGHVPLFCDVDPVTSLMHAEHVQSALGDLTLGAILPSSLNGCGYPAGYWDAISEKMSVPVVLDAAGSIGFQPAGNRIVTVYSLHATKPLSAAEGGVIICDDENFLASVRARSNFGFSDSQVMMRGTNGKMSEYHAAVGLVSLEEWQETSDALRCHFDVYQSALRSTGAKLRVVNQSGICSVLAVAFNRDRRNEAQAALGAAGIETRRWYLPPLNQHSNFRSCPRSENLDVTDKLDNELLGLPYGLHLDAAQISLITKTLGRLAK